MDRRTFLGAGLGLAGALTLPGAKAIAALPPAKITRIRYYRSPTDAAGRAAPQQPTFNQSTHIVIVETDQGLTGIGEGGAPDVMQQLAGQLIGEDPFRTERLWQIMHRGYFYPAGREKTHALGALDIALWDIKAKALGVPLWQLLGGRARDYIECYATGFSIPGQQNASHGERARACIEAGFRAYRLHDPGPQEVFDRFDQVKRMYGICKEIRDATGKDGSWAIDYHGAYDMNDAIALSDMIEPLRPYFVEDLIRSDNIETYADLRRQVKVPVAVGEVLGNKWDWTKLIEEDLMDYGRVTIPNVGGVTEYMKITAMCEAHMIGLIPHFTGPVATATLVHCNAANSLPVLMEMTGGGRRTWPYLKTSYDFANGKLQINNRPGVGCELDTSKVQIMAEYTERYAPIPTRKRPDGTYTNW